MTTLSWPTGRIYIPQSITWGANVPKSKWVAFYTGQSQSIAHYGHRLRMTMSLMPVPRASVEAAAREAFLLQLAGRGDWVTLHHFLRPSPLGTMAGSPTVYANAAAGATSLQIQTTAGATLVGGDVIKANGQLIIVGYAGMVADGSGVGTCPVAIPLRKALTTGQAITYSAPTGTFQLVEDAVDIAYRPGKVQLIPELNFIEVF